MIFGHRLNKAICVLSVVTLVLLAATGCHRDDVKVYRIAKEQEQSSQPAAPALSTDSPNPKLPPGHPDISSIPGGGPASATGAPQLTWKTPDGWTEAPPTEMRLASFKVSGAGGKQADVSIVPLPGMAGTDSANVNRWRGQVGLSAMTDDELLKAAENVEAGGQPAQLYDIAGTNPGSGDKERIIGVIQHRDGMTWFYKMTGDADLVEQQKPAFVEFLKSLNFGAAAEMPAANLAMPGTSLGSQNFLVPDTNTTVMGGLLSASAPVSAANKPTWQVPAGWQEVTAGQFLVAKFTLTGDGGATAAVNVSSSPGDGGGLAANVNRWRGQLGLSPSPDISATPVDITSGKASLVDFSGTDARTGQPARLVGIVVARPDQTWFYKLMGDAKVVESQKDAFTKFVQGVKY
jgi:hypothetical protein